MTKLTVSMRDQIVANAVDKSGITKAQEELQIERRVWANAVADESIGGAAVVALLGEANKKVARIINTLPEGLREEILVGPRVGSITAAFGGRRMIVREWEGYRPAKAGLMLAADHPLTIHFEQLETRQTELEQRRNSLRQEVRAVVNSCSTINKLLTVWPEAKELLPQQSKPVTSLPAVQVDKLNAAIGLPSEE